MQSYKSVSIFLVVLLLTRPLLYSVGLQVFGTDPVKDFMYFNSLMDDWQGSLLRQSVADAQYPPGLGLMMQLGNWWGLPHPQDVRASFMMWDAVATLAALWYLRPIDQPYWRLALMLIFLVPLTAIWAQDEVIAAAFLALVIVLLNQSLWRSAIALTVFAVACVKIFFLPLCGLLLVAAWRHGVSRPWLLMSAAGVLCILIWQLSGDSSGLSQFVPPNDFGISLWSLSPVMEQAPAKAAYHKSLLIFVVLGGAWGLWSLVRLRSVSSALLVFAVLMHIFTLSFYHVSPEYLVFVCWPYLLLPQTASHRIALQCMATWSLAWGVNVLYYLQQVHPLLITGHHVMLIAFNLTSLMLLISVLRALLSAHSRGANPERS
ncbi:MAG: hypothetical protein AABY68_00045 [Pseudomonadota bacterium]